MDLGELQKQFTGRKFGELVLHHRKKQGLQTMVAALVGRRGAGEGQAARLTCPEPGRGNRNGTYRHR